MGHLYQNLKKSLGKSGNQKSDLVTDVEKYVNFAPGCHIPVEISHSWFLTSKRTILILLISQFQFSS